MNLCLTAHECKPSTEGNSNSESAASNVNSSNVKSDAILNCPACLITVCIDCQRFVVLLVRAREKNITIEKM